MIMRIYLLLMNIVCYREILKVTKVSQLKFVVTEDLAHIGLSKPEQRRYKKIYSKFFPNPYISKIRKLLSANKKNELVSVNFVNITIILDDFYSDTGSVSVYYRKRDRDNFSAV